MNETSKASLPYDLNVVADIDVAGETDIAAYLKSRDVDMGIYADSIAQISLYEAEITYGDLFEGQDLNLWHIDSDIPEVGVSVVSISDFNRALAAQGKAPYAPTLAELTKLLSVFFTFFNKSVFRQL